MSASEVTDFERSFRYFAIWLHRQVFAKLLLGLFFQRQKSAWTYFKKLSQQVLIRIRTKQSWRHTWTSTPTCVYAHMHLHVYTCISVDFQRESQAFQLDFIPDPTWCVQCLVDCLTLNEAPKYSVPALLNWVLLHWPWVWKDLWNCWAALEGHTGQPREMIANLAYRHVGSLSQLLVAIKFQWFPLMR